MRVMCIHTCFIPVIHTMEYYSTIKKNENVPLTAAWMNLKGIILSEISKIQKEKHYMILYTESKIVTLTETKGRSVAARS